MLTLKSQLAVLAAALTLLGSMTAVMPITASVPIVGESVAHAAGSDDDDLDDLEVQR